MSLSSRMRFNRLVLAVAAIACGAISGVAEAQVPTEEVPAETRGSCALAWKGTDSRDTLLGTADGDLITGGGGADDLRGLDGNDCLKGGPQRDVLVGGDGRDRLNGGSGADQIMARDGRRDLIRCGPGRDLARIDRRDRSKGCERVLKRAPEPDSDDGPPDVPGGETDTTAPNTTITAGPAAGSSTTSTSASFSFTGSDNVGVSAYECQLDGSSWSGCSSPDVASGLAVGAHTFAVRAKDAAGNLDASPATRSWSVSPPDDPDALRVPASVPAGCSSDATGQILSWIASVPNGSTLSFDPGACYRIEGTIELRNRNLVIDGNGATFKSQNAPTPNRAVWRAWNSDLTLRDMKLVGSYANGGTHDPDLQWAHGIDLRGTHGVVEDVSMSDLAGDCVYFGLGAGRSSGAVRDSSCRRIGRNAVSVVAGDDIRVERTTTNQIGFTAFDVEPNTGSGNGSARVVFDSNMIGSYQVLAWAIVGHAPVTDQSFTNNTVTGRGLRIGVLFPDHRPKNLTVTGNTAEEAQTPAAMEFTSIDGLTVRNNSVPLTDGTMAAVAKSCGVDVSGNQYPGGSRQVSITDPAC